MTRRTERLFKSGQMELPIVGAGGTDELEGEGEGAWGMVWFESVVDGDFGGGPEGLLVEEDLGVRGYPTVEEDGSGVGSEQGGGDLGARELFLGVSEELGELVEVSRGEGQEYLVGELCEDASLGDEGVGGVVLEMGGGLAGRGGAGDEDERGEKQERGKTRAA